MIAIAGHTPGSIALLYRDPDGHPHLFTGDSLFPGGVGNTFGDEDAFAQLIDEVETKVFERAARRHLVLPGPRRRLDPRRRAAVAARSGASAAGEPASRTVEDDLRPGRRRRRAALGRSRRCPAAAASPTGVTGRPGL